MVYSSWIFGLELDSLVSRSDTNIINNKEYIKEKESRNDILLKIRENQNNTLENKKIRNIYDDIPIK